MTTSLYNSQEKRESYKKALAEQFKTLLQRDGTNWINGIQGADLEAPRNAVTDRKYNGSNAFMLMLNSAVAGYDDPRWATMAQIMDKNHTLHPHERWHLKAGSHGLNIEYWFPYDRENKTYVSWNNMKNDILNGRKPEDYRIVNRYYYVFNATMIEGISPYERDIVLHSVHSDELIHQLSEAMNVPIILDTKSEAYYSPSQDCVHLPSDPRRFRSSAEYNGTALHELCHSTGNAKRLDRNMRNTFGSANYAYEELIAEMGSCFMAIDLENIDVSSFNHFENNEKYLRSWLQATEDPDALLKAIKEAQKASDYMEMQVGIQTQREFQEKYDIGEKQKNRISTEQEYNVTTSSEKKDIAMQHTERKIELSHHRSHSFHH